MEKYDLTNKKELIKVTKDIMSGPFANALIAVNPLVPVILNFGGMILDKIYSTETLKLQKDTAESLIKRGKENGVDEMEITVKNSRGFKLNVPIDEYNHLMDAMRYAMEPFSMPQRFGFSGDY